MSNQEKVNGPSWVQQRSNSKMAFGAKIAEDVVGIVKADRTSGDLYVPYVEVTIYHKRYFRNIEQFFENESDAVAHAKKAFKRFFKDAMDEHQASLEQARQEMGV